VERIGKAAFTACGKLTFIEVPEDNGYFLSAAGVLFTREVTELIQYPAGKSGDYEIPADVTGIKIKAYAFHGSSGLTSVVIPVGVTEIEGHVFAGCTGLKDVHVSWQDLSQIATASDAFSDISDNITLHVPLGTESAYGEAEPWTNFLISTAQTDFKYTVNDNKATLTGYTGPGGNITIPGTITERNEQYPVTVIGEEAFSGLSNLTSVEIPGTVTTIAEKAFSACSSLTAVTIPASVTSIEAGAFSACSSLNAFTVAEGNNSYAHTDDGVLCNKAQTELIQYPAGKNGSYILSNEVEKISEWAFHGCVGLDSVTIPESVKGIGASAFAGCTGLTDVHVSWQDLSQIATASDAFSGITPGKITLHVPPGTETAYYGIDPWKNLPISTAQTDFQFTSNGTTAILTGYTGDATSVIIPDTITVKNVRHSVTDIGEEVFSGRGDLTSVYIPGSVTRIKNKAFFACVNLADVIIPDGVISIGEGAFAECSGLDSVTIGKSVISIGDSAFAGCSGLSDVLSIPDGVISIGASAFDGCSNLTSVFIPRSVTSIGAKAFAGCDSLKDVTVEWENNLPNISNENVFQGVPCAEATLHIPGGKEVLYQAAAVWKTFGTILEPTIASGSDGDWTWILTGVSGSNYTLTISGSGAMADYASPDKIPWYGYRENIETLTLKQGITHIGELAFHGCSRLTNITVPAGVASIGAGAFSACSGLTSFTVAEGNTVFSSEEGVLFKNAKSALIQYPAGKKGSYTIPGSVRSIEFAAFENCSGLTSVTIPDGVTTIGAEAFYGCVGLTSVAIPNGVKTIGELAFRGCSGLTSVIIPSSVTTIGNSAFAACSHLTSITVADGNMDYVSIAGVLFNYRKTTLIQYPARKSDSYYEIPAGVTSIAMSAFDSTLGLGFVKIPEDVTHIGDFAFGGCGNLKDVTVEWETPLPLISDNIFQGVPSLKAKLHVPVGSRISYQTAAGWKMFGDIIDDVILRPKPSLFVSPQSLIFAANGGDTLLIVTANVNWRAVTVSADTTKWLTIVDLNADGVINAADLLADSILTVRAAAYTGTEYRSAEITFTFGDEDDPLTRKKVYITQNAPVHPQNILLNKTNLILPVGKKEQLVATVLPANAYNRSVIWSSDNTKVAVVSSGGLVTALSEGTAVITAYTAVDNLAKSCTVKVEEQHLIAEPDLPANSHGSIDVSLKIPTDEQFWVTFTLTLPSGFNLNQSATVPAEALKGRYELLFKSDGKGGWMFGIKPLTSTRSADDMTYQKVVTILYTLDDTVQVGDHTVKIKDTEVRLLGSDGSDTTIRQQEINIPVTVIPGATGTAEGIWRSSPSSVWYYGGLLHIDTPQSEGITIYSMIGRMLHRVRKPEGAAVFDLNGLPRGVLMIRGDSGWTQKIIR
jgi:hypothetical protein